MVSITHSVLVGLFSFMKGGCVHLQSDPKCINQFCVTVMWLYVFLFFSSKKKVHVITIIINKFMEWIDGLQFDFPFNSISVISV